MKNCRHFNGYKPCGRAPVCDLNCPKLDVLSQSILIVHLGALGAVVRSTALLKAVHRKYPQAHVTWVTDTPAQHLLRHNPLIDRVLTTNGEDQLVLRALKFDVGFVVDKSLKAIGVAQSTRCEKIFGFLAEGQGGGIAPATAAARELWLLGLSDEQKFFHNKKSEIQLATEALELPYQRDEYHVPLTQEEVARSATRRAKWTVDYSQPVIGFNTGCAATIPAKKWTVEFHRSLIARLISTGYRNIVLLGGPEDGLRNQQIAQGLPVVESPTDEGLRDGLVSTKACDLVITGDSLGMHMAIAMKRFVIAWFGPTCAHEIDLFDRGVALLADVACSPCWKRTCEKPVMCYNQVDLKSIDVALEQGIQWHRSTSKLPFLETSVLPSLL